MTSDSNDISEDVAFQFLRRVQGGFLNTKNRVETALSKSILFSEKWVSVYKRITYRLWRLGAELATIIGSLAIIWLYALSNLLSNQSVDISNAKNNLGLLFADAVAGAGVDIPDMKLDWYPATNDIVFTGRNISIQIDDGTEVQKLKVLRSYFPLADVQKGILIPRKVELEGGVVSWVEDDKGRIRAGLGTPETLGRLGPLWEGRRSTARRAGRLNIDGVKTVRLTNGSAFYINENNGLSLELDAVSLDFDDVEGALSFDLNALAQQENLEPAKIHLDLETDRQFDKFDVSYTTDALNPSVIGPKRGRFKQVRDVNAPLTVLGEFVFDRQDGLQSAQINMKVSAGTISTSFQDEPFSLDSFNVEASLDPGQETMQVNQFDLIGDTLRFSAEGTLSELGAISDGDINSSPLFDLAFKNINFDMRPTLEGKVALGSLDLAGRLDVDDQVLDISALTVNRRSHAIKGSLYVDMNSDGKVESLKSTGVMSGAMNMPELLQIWPVKFADGARRWVERSILGGDIDSLSFEADFARDETGKLIQNIMTVDYSLRDGTVQYISTMTPATEVFGIAKISDNSLVATLSEGNIGPLKLLPSRAEIPRLTPKGGDIILNINIDGEASDMLSLLNQKPFQYADLYGVNPEDLGGTGQVEVKIIRPLLEYFDQSRIVYLIKGGFKDAIAPFQIGDNRITDGDISVDVNETGLRVWGDVNVGPWRARMEWAETFDNGLTPTRYHLFGDMPHSVLDSFGFAMREYFDGTIGVDVRATGSGLMIEGATVEADFKDTEITLGEFWVKEKEKPGDVKASFTRDETGLTVRSFEADAPNLNLVGNMAFTPNFALKALNLDVLNIEGLVDGRLKVSPNDARDSLMAEFEGRSLDISAIIDSSVSSQTSALDVPVDFKGQADSLILDPLYVAKDATFNYTHNGEAVTAAFLKAQTDEGALRINLNTDDDEARRIVSITLPDAEKATQAFLGIESLRGGVVSLNGYLPLAGEDGNYSGELVIDDFMLRDAPILAQLLSFGSLTGLVDTLSGDGLAFERLTLPFQLKGGVLSVRDARVYGPALGMTGEGNVNLNDKLIDIDGALAPAYTANSLLGDIPVLGDLIIGKEGEGVFGLNYSVTGPFEAAQVSVNPLSALTPGFLRGIFRKEREELDIETLDEKALEDAQTSSADNDLVISDQDETPSEQARPQDEGP